MYPQTILFIDLHSLEIASYLARTGGEFASCGRPEEPDTAAIQLTPTTLRWSTIFTACHRDGNKKSLSAAQRGMSSEAMSG
jgi:hypothetical protein